MTGRPWLWQVKHCLRRAMDPLAPASSSGSALATAPRIAFVFSRPAAGALDTPWALSRTARPIITLWIVMERLHFSTIRENEKEEPPAAGRKSLRDSRLAGVLRVNQSTDRSHYETLHPDFP